MPASPHADVFDPATLAWDDRGLIPAIAQDAATGEVLMMAWMSAESLRVTLETGRATYWSRSRNALWKKGETSGHVQRLVELRVDCDRDCLLLLVEQTGPACHTMRRTCFYTAIRDGAEVELMAPEA
ncbi:MAG: phosphoribosyl-AMP cyclohydrolase [Paracoccaceae bacterium]|jgi:phosphoribosyl-AMP cyclohydrolase|nr:phosphoribosyl-AMP cyclohydrolase [Paracoccaceae bacterium]